MIDLWIDTAHRKHSRLSKDIDSTMAEDPDDPYDFTEDGNSQRFLSLANMTTHVPSFLLLHIQHFV